MNRFLSIAFVAQSLRIALPYLAASMAGIWSERAGVVNVALEGTMLFSALFAVIGTSASGSPWIGLLTAIVAGVALQLVHGAAVLKGHANAIVSGLALNLFAGGASRFLLRAVYDSSSNSPSIPGLVSAVPTAAIVLVVVLTLFAFARTRLGLRVRAVGEHPDAAAAAGVPVLATRLYALAIAGASAALGGAWLAFDQRQFNSGMSGGRGFIALAIVVVSGWNPTRAVLFALCFGAAGAAEIELQDQHLVSHHLVQMLPYVATLVALAGLVGRSRPPAALGKL